MRVDGPESKEDRRIPYALCCCMGKLAVPNQKLRGTQVSRPGQNRSRSRPVAGNIYRCSYSPTASKTSLTESRTQKILHSYCVVNRVCRWPDSVLASSGNT